LQMYLEVLHNGQCGNACLSILILTHHDVSFADKGTVRGSIALRHLGIFLYQILYL